MFNGYCPLLEKEIHEGVCIEIIAEIYGAKKKEIILDLEKHKSILELENICEKCPNYPS